MIRRKIKRITQAFREVVVSFSTLVAVIASIVVLARTLTSTYFTDLIPSAVDITITRTTLRISIITETALVTER